MSLAWIVQRWEMTLDDKDGIVPYAEVVCLSKDKAQAICDEFDPSGKGFEYTCPCGCGLNHWRSWSIEAVPFCGDKEWTR